MQKKNKMINLILTFFLIGLVAGLLGLFYRNCLKVPNMIFSWWYEILKNWVKKSDVRCDENGCTYPSTFWKFMGWIARPLGYCIYCSTQWITFFMCLIIFSSYEVLPYWQDIVTGVIAASGISHLTVCIACRFLIMGNPDLDY